ncbi:MAG: GMC family oxidoreductase [Polyangiaceae bacterium]|jgi:choline dehydrogenase-like flavoprotein
MTSDPVDVVVVGSGAGGAPAAYALAQAGVRVLVIDKGRRHCSEDFDHDEVRMCRRTFFTPSITEDPHTLRVGDKVTATRTSAGWVSTVVGGGTVHMSGYFYRLHPVDFKLRSTLGAIQDSTVEDWPIQYSDLEPFYDAVERELGVSGVWHAHPFEEPRRADFPCPPLAENSVARKIDEVCARLDIHPFPTPRAIISRGYRDRMACMYCALCASYGCEIGAKCSTLATFLPAAEATGHCEVRSECMVTEIPVDGTGRVTGVVYRTRKGDTVVQRARCVVVACTAIESARLLLLSRSATFPNGLANSNGLVGKNLVFSGEARGEALFRRTGRDGAPWLLDEAPFVQRSVQDYYYFEHPVEGLRKAGTIVFALAHPNPILTAERISGSGVDARWGLRLKEALRAEAAGARTLTFETFGEFLPTPGTYVDLDPNVTDRWGLPVARITLGRHSLDAVINRFLAARGRLVLDALGPDSSKITQDDGQDMVLQGGTCRFGRDPATSVLDVNCQAHGVPNLYVSDGSFMPTSGGVPGTLTIMANALRVGRHLVDRFRANGL